jgi:cardiolipin synthase
MIPVERHGVSAPVKTSSVTPLPVTRGPSFARGLWRIAAADVSSGNRVRLLHDGPETFDEMLDLIHKAKRSVALESYILRSDEVGERFSDALVAASKRGVAARVITDWIGARGTTSRFYSTLRKAGVDIRVYNTPGIRAWLGLLPRDHRKLLVVDEAIGVTGGVGIGREWLQGVATQRRTRWRDAAIRIEGPAAAAMLQAFENMWGRVSRNERRGSHRFLKKRPSGAHLDPATHEPALVGIIEGEPMRLRVARALQMQAIAAERSIWIASAYFTPSWAEVEALTGAARDGVDVRVLVPSRNDHPWVTMLTRRYYRRLLTNGVRVWEWKGEMMHAKTSVVDGRWVRVGSTDFNLLGVAINYELDALVEDPTIGSEAAERFLSDLDDSHEVNMRNRSVGR